MFHMFSDWSKKAAGSQLLGRIEVGGTLDIRVTGRDHKEREKGEDGGKREDGEPGNGLMD